MIATTYAVAVGVADVRRDPDPTSELVTQALLNRPVAADKENGEWTHVTLSDYEGWIRTDELAEPAIKGFTQIGEYCATPLDLVAVVTVTHTPLYAEPNGEDTLDTIYLSTVLPLVDTTHPARVQVALPGAGSGWIARAAVQVGQGQEVYSSLPINAITNYARAFSDVPYLWGGTSYRGIDCSGFVQLCYRIGGYRIPRDADQQNNALPRTVEREEMQAGDLIFFGRQHITHVAMALSNKEYIHAEGHQYNRVIINSFDPAAPNYNARLAEIVRSVKRVV